MRRWVKKATILVIGATLLGVGVMGRLVERVDAKSAGTGDVEKVLAYADKTLTAGYTITLRSHGTIGHYNGPAELATEGRQLAATVYAAIGALANGALVTEKTELGGRVYKSDATSSHVRMSVRVAASENKNSCFVIIRLDTDNRMDREALLEWQLSTERTLEELGIPVKWNVVVQGSLEHEVQTDGQRQSLLLDATTAFHAMERERYIDDRTLSVSFDAPSLYQSVQSGGRRISLQVALHHISTTGIQRLTIGAPLITTEY